MDNQMRRTVSLSAMSATNLREECTSDDPDDKISGWDSRSESAADQYNMGYVEAVNHPWIIAIRERFPAKKEAIDFLIDAVIYARLFKEETDEKTQAIFMGHVWSNVICMLSSLGVAVVVSKAKEVVDDIMKSWV